MISFFMQFDKEFQTLCGDATSKLISTWETRFVPGILHVAKMSKLPKIISLLNDLYDLHDTLPSAEDADPEDGDYEPSSGIIQIQCELLISGAHLQLWALCTSELILVNMQKSVLSFMSCAHTGANSFHANANNNAFVTPK